MIFSRSRLRAGLASTLSLLLLGCGDPSPGPVLGDVAVDSFIDTSETLDGFVPSDVLETVDTMDVADSLGDSEPLDITLADDGASQADDGASQADDGEADDAVFEADDGQSGPACCPIQKDLECTCAPTGGTVGQLGGCVSSCDSDPGEWVFGVNEDGCPTLNLGQGSCIGGFEVPAMSAALCPDGPYASAPLSSLSVAATELSGSSSQVYSDGLAEGPVWVDGVLYFSFFAGGPTPPASIMRFTPGVGVEVAVANSGSNGLAVDNAGQIWAGTHDDGGISRFNPITGERTVVVNSYQGNRLNSPNDLVLRADGVVFFTDPTWQAPSPAPQPVTGVYRWDPGQGLSLVDGTLDMPNGIALSGDGYALYVGHPGGVRRYQINAFGDWFQSTGSFGSGLSNVDGLAVDCANNLYVTQHGAGTVTVLDTYGNSLGTINVASSLTNAAFGGPNRKTLFLTAGSPATGNALFSVDLAIPGLPY